MKYRLVDRIFQWDRWRTIRGCKTVTFEEYQLPRPGAETGHLPRSLELEAATQLASWLVVVSSDFAQIGLLQAVEEARFERALGPGERLDLSLTVTHVEADHLAFNAQGCCGDRAILHVTGAALWRRPLAPHCDAQDLRVLLEQIHRPIPGAVA